MSCYVSTWFCLDEKDDESNYSQMKSMGKSSSFKFQSVYWKNIYVFYFTFKKYNPTVKFLFFSNVAIPEYLNGDQSNQKNSARINEFIVKTQKALLAGAFSKDSSKCMLRSSVSFSIASSR